MEFFKNILKDWKIMELGEFTELLIKNPKKLAIYLRIVKYIHVVKP